LVTLNLNLLVFLEQNAWLYTSTSNGLAYTNCAFVEIAYHIDIEFFNLMMQLLIQHI